MRRFGEILSTQHNGASKCNETQRSAWFRVRACETGFIAGTDGEVCIYQKTDVSAAPHAAQILEALLRAHLAPFLCATLPSALQLSAWSLGFGRVIKTTFQLLGGRAT